jgi:hypothetical protein
MHAPANSGLFCESDVSGRDVALAAVSMGNAFLRKGFISKIVLNLWPSLGRGPVVGRDRDEEA